jgi:hypothetical protein
MMQVVKRLLLALLALAGCKSSPEINDRTDMRAPDFTLNDTEGSPVALKQLLARGPVIVAFFPKAFTAG